MDAPSTSRGGGLKVVETKLECMRGDLITIPMFFNNRLKEPDTQWMVPTSIFHSKCVGEAIDEFWSFEEALIKIGGVREATNSEMGWLFRHYYIPHSKRHLILAPYMNLLVVSQDLDECEQLEALIASMQAKEPPTTEGEVIFGEDPFPSFIPKTSLTMEELKAKYSLTSTTPSLKGSMWEKQMHALKEFKSNPPISTLANVTKVGDSTFNIMAKHIDGYIGFCHLHLNKEPTMDLIMEPTHFARFIAFLEVSWGGRWVHGKHLCFGLGAQY